MIRGQSANVALPPVINADSDEFSVFAPQVHAITNGRVDGSGIWKKRPGLKPWKTLGNKRVDLLIPENDGYAVDAGGDVWVLTPHAKLVSTRSDGFAPPVPKLEASLEYPSFARFRDEVVVVNGSQGAIAIDLVNRTTRRISGGIPSGHLVATVDDVVLIAGHDGARFDWSEIGNVNVWPNDNFQYLNFNGQTIRAMRVLQRQVHFFRDHSIEVFGNIGGVEQFVRRGVIDRGTPAGRSVVLAQDRFYFYGDDGQFYALAGTQLQAIPARDPRQLRKITEGIKHPQDMYGMHFPNEGVIRWVAPVEGFAFVYDYRNDVMSEDYSWENGARKRLRIHSSMVRGAETFVGDEETGRVYRWSEDQLVDQIDDSKSNPIHVARKFSFQVSPDRTTARVNRLRFRVRRGQTTELESRRPKFLFRYAIDRQEFSDFIEFDLGRTGETFPYLDLHTLGVAREITVELIETDADNFVLTDMQVTAEPLGL